MYRICFCSFRSLGRIVEAERRPKNEASTPAVIGSIHVLEASFLQGSQLMAKTNEGIVRSELK